MNRSSLGKLSIGSARSKHILEKALEKPLILIDGSLSDIDNNIILTQHNEANNNAVHLDETLKASVDISLNNDLFEHSRETFEVENENISGFEEKGESKYLKYYFCLIYL